MLALDVHVAQIEMFDQNGSIWAGKNSSNNQSKDMEANLMYFEQTFGKSLFNRKIKCTKHIRLFCVHKTTFRRLIVDENQREHFYYEFLMEFLFRFLFQSTQNDFRLVIAFFLCSARQSNTCTSQNLSVTHQRYYHH